MKTFHSEDLSDYSFLVTGGAGFIGSNIVEYLISHNAKKVRILDDLSTGLYDNIKAFENYKSFEFIKGDICNYDTCLKAMEGIDYVSHQAALGSVPRSINNPLRSNKVNISGFLNIMYAVKNSSNVKKIVYAASSSTYGDSKILPKQEEVIGKPLSPYAVTKYVNELYADVFHKTYGVKSIGLRYFNVFGPKQNPSGAYAAVIPLFIKALLNQDKPTINGDGEQTRDFTYVENAVQANIKALFADVENTVLNIALGERISLNQLWSNLNKLHDKMVEANYGPDRVGDVRDSLANISKAIEKIDYKPEVNVNEGLKLTYNWFKANK